MTEKTSAVVLISGSGSNLQAIIDAIENNTLGLQISLVISNKPDVKGLERATAAGIATQVIEAKNSGSRDDYDQVLAAAVGKSDAELVILAGFMRILSDAFVNQFQGKLINIHPSLLPLFRGLHTHERVLQAKCRFHGASVHYVTPALDDGPVIAQAKLEVNKNDTATDLAVRILAIEHKLYPLALNLAANNRIQMQDDSIRFDGKILEQPLQYNPIRNELCLD